MKNETRNPDISHIYGNHIEDWIEQVINGMGGFKSWEDHEWVSFHGKRDEGIAGFVLRCLANPKCKGSEEVLKAIQERRENMSQ